jgi:hypothetical protein
MRKIFILIAFMFLTSYTTINVVAQNNTRFVSIGVGQFFNSTLSGSYSFTFLNTSKTQKTSQFTPIFALAFEKRFFKHLSIGAEYNRLTAKSVRTNQTSGLLQLSTQSTEKVDATLSGIALNLKGFVYSNAAFDAYITAKLGILNVAENVDKTFISSDNPTQSIITQETPQSLTVLLTANVGARYFITKNVGIYGEIGATYLYRLSGAAFQGGVIYSF